MILKRFNTFLDHLNSGRPTDNGGIQNSTILVSEARVRKANYVKDGNRSYGQNSTRNWVKR